MEEHEARKETEAHVKKVTLEQMAKMMKHSEAHERSTAKDRERDREAARKYLRGAGQGGSMGGGADVGRVARQLQEEYINSPQNLQGRGGVERRQGMDDDISMFTRWQFSSIHVKKPSNHR